MGWLINEGPKWVITAVWLLANVGFFIGYFFKYHNTPEYFYLQQLVGLGLPFARGSAACLNFNCMLILLPVCRNLISYMRGSFICKCCKRNVRRQLDKNLKFHKVLSYMIALMTAIHVVAHCFNLELLWQAHNSPNNATRGLLSALSNLPTTHNGTWINPVRTYNTNPIIEMLKLVSGITGVVITLGLILMLSSSTEIIRRSYFEVFWYTHHIFVIFFIGLVIHGVQGVVRMQTNIAQHDPYKCYQKYKEWSDRNPVCPMPQFGHSGAKTWMWVIGPVLIYIFERLLRFIRARQKVVITKVVQHPSKVIELQMKKRGFTAESGQYIFLHCPKVSALEWHPFTLTSAPQDDHFSVHIRTVGDWTTALSKACQPQDGSLQEAWQLPSVAVDGPFGTASEDYSRYQVAVLAAAGIGVTPFASVLKDIWYKYNDPSYEMKLRKVYFYWVCPDTQAFEWFADLLSLMDDQMLEAGRADFLDYNIYLTRGWNPNQAKNIILHEDDAADAITGLKQKTHYGRPQWDQIFSSIASAHPGVSVGVFFCGPKALSSTLHKMCNQHSVPGGMRFVYNKENF